MLNEESEKSVITNIEAASTVEALPTGQPTGVRDEVACPEAYVHLSPEQKARAQQLHREIDKDYPAIRTTLRNIPEVQSRCLRHLLEAEKSLNHCPLQPEDIINATGSVAEVDIELTKATAGRMSFIVVGVVSYVLALLVYLAYCRSLFESRSAAAELNKYLVVGIPLPVWLWSIIGSFTSMLLRASQFPFVDVSEAVRWLLSRPIVGTVMGVLTYLLVVAGLIVFTGTGTTNAPELIWVIAFVGSFSDTLSINLLQRILGEFKPVQTRAPSKAKSPPDKG
jgi:hypothetical protein